MQTRHILFRVTFLLKHSNSAFSVIIYRIARNFHRTLFLEISETSGIFRNFLQNGALKFFKLVAKKEK